MNGLKVPVIAAVLSAVFYSVAYFSFHPIAEALGVDTGVAVDDFIDNPFEVVGVLTSNQMTTMLLIYSIVMISGIIFAVILSLLAMLRVKKEEG